MPDDPTTPQPGRRVFPARIVGTGTDAIALYPHLNGVELHTVTSRDHAGATAGGWFTPARYLRTDMLDGRGCSLWRAVAARLTLPPPPFRGLVRFEAIATAVGRLFEAVQRDGGAIAGRELPLSADTPFDAFDAATWTMWHFDLVTGEAVPQRKGTAATYADVRMFTADEWAGLPQNRTTAGVDGAAIASPDPGRGKGGKPAVHDWNLFTQEVVRIANNDGFTTRGEIAKHMRDWCDRTWGPDKGPDDRTIARKLKDILPPELPER